MNPDIGSHKDQTGNCKEQGPHGGYSQIRARNEFFGVSLLHFPNPLRKFYSESAFDVEHQTVVTNALSGNRHFLHRGDSPAPVIPAIPSTKPLAAPASEEKAPTPFSAAAAVDSASIRPLIIPKVPPVPTAPAKVPANPRPAPRQAASLPLMHAFPSRRPDPKPAAAEVMPNPTDPERAPLAAAPSATAAAPANPSATAPTPVAAAATPRAMPTPITTPFGSEP